MTYNRIVEASPTSLPAPILSIEVALSMDVAQSPDLKALPTRPGVFVFEDETGGTLALATTANLRRMVATRLAPIAADEGATRRIDYRGHTRLIRAVPVGGGFEADWAYLQLARTRIPTACRAALDRWQAWFVRCDPNAQFPQWTKTAHPNRGGGVHLGPFPDKHAAGRYIELLEDAFDLCRYHHILVQSPDATACAYKEMGKCPAPCDGSISMQLYREQIRAAIEFGATPIDDFRELLEVQLSHATSRSDSVLAGRAQKLLDRTAVAAKPSFSHVRRLDEFRMLAVMPSEREGWVRVFAILGGNVDPLLDVCIDLDRRECAEVHSLLMTRTESPVDSSTESARENLALVCWHLFRPPKARQRGVFLNLNSSLTPAQLQKAMRIVAKPDAQPGLPVTEHFTEDAGLSTHLTEHDPHHGQNPPHHHDED